MCAKSIKVVHYNRQKQAIDMQTEYNRARIEKIVREVVNRTVKQSETEWFK